MRRSAPLSGPRTPACPTPPRSSGEHPGGQDRRASSSSSHQHRPDHHANDSGGTLTMDKTKQSLTIAAVAIVAVVAGGWFLLISPQRASVASLNSDTAA